MPLVTVNFYIQIRFVVKRVEIVITRRVMRDERRIIEMKIKTNK